MASATAITAITDSLPPATDYITYLTILESHLSSEILPKLNEILQNATLTQNIGWDLIHLLIPLPGAEACLNTIAQLGNPREVILQVTEALRSLRLDGDDDAEDDEAPEEDPKEDPEAPGDDDVEKSAKTPLKTSEIEKFCTLVSLLATLHPRIKTKYPSRFLSTSLMAILSSYRPSDHATYAIIAFVHAVSGAKRPPLPQRKSSASSNFHFNAVADAAGAPDPEATAEDPRESAIQKKLLQSFVTHTLAEYTNKNNLEWAARLQEHFQPKKVVQGRKSIGQAFREEEALQERDNLVGQLAALARDLGLEGHQFLLDCLKTVVPREEGEDDDEEDESPPSNPDDIPLSQAGSLILVTSSIFSSIMFDAFTSMPKWTIFPDHASLVEHFIGTNGPDTVGTEETGVIDSILAIGLWLESSNKFVAGPLEDEAFLQQIQTLSLLSANTPNPTLRYNAHLLTSSILHAHPVDRTRLTFISDTLENCPYENLKASAVGWLKEEIMTAHERKSDNAFSTTVALASTQPYLFPDMSTFTDLNVADAWADLKLSFPFHMAVLNFIIFIGGDAYSSVVPSGMLSVVEEIYLGPLRALQRRVETAVNAGGPLREKLNALEADTVLSEIHLLGDRLDMCLE